MIVIIDYDMGNIGSVANILKRIGKKPIVTNDLALIAEASHIILPGVGAFDSGMKQLDKFGLIPVIRQKALIDKVPILGICLGAQLMLQKSEEGILPGLGLINGSVVRFDFSNLDNQLRIPFMGWENVLQKKNHYLSDKLPDTPRFYFVHSYHFKLNDYEDILFESVYGYRYTSAFVHENIAGVQFHPEKSHKFGMALLKNFSEWHTA